MIFRLKVLFKKTAANLHDFLKPPTSFFKKKKFKWKTNNICLNLINLMNLINFVVSLHL